MKRFSLIIFSAILALGFVSCKRANTAAETIVIDSLQTFTDSLLRQKLMEREAEWGCVVLMEIESDEIKVLSNIDRNEDGTYSMQKNRVKECMEPGPLMSTYPLKSLLEDDKVSLNDTCPEDSIILRRFGRNITIRQAFVSGMLPYNDSQRFSPLGIVEFYRCVANGNELIELGFCKESTLRDIRSALHDVVWDNEYGAASITPWGMRKAQSDIVHIAGKTGTVRISEDDHYNNRKHRIAFVGYFPEEDPEYTCLCIIHCPKSFYDAGTDCGGIVRKIAERIYSPKQEQNTHEHHQPSRSVQS